MNSHTHELTITTPEGISFTLTLASPLTRFLAWTVDVACLWAATSVLNSVLQTLGLLSPDLASALLILAYFVTQIGYGIALEWFWRGQTLGKRLFRLRVMDEQGLSLQFNQVVIRNLLRAVDSLPVLYFVGGLACLINRKAQRLGDLAARTVVVRTLPVTTPDLQEVLSHKFNSLREYPHLAARLRQRVSPPEAEIALQAVLRRNDIAPEARLAVFAEIAAHFKKIVEFPQESTDGISDEQYVRNVVEMLFQG
jgi:uncharacterized RDD family membrane protein YckC